MKFPTEMTYRIPIYPGWRMWLWRILRIKRPAWAEYHVTGIRMSRGKLVDGEMTYDMTFDTIEKVA